MTGSAAVLQSAQGYQWTAPIALPFAFEFYKATQPSFTLNVDGILGFGSSPLESLPPACNPPDPSQFFPQVFVFSDNSIPTPATGPMGICYATTGSAPDRSLVATWEAAMVTYESGSSETFTVVLHESTNVIDFLYGTMVGPRADGNQVAAGLQVDHQTGLRVGDLAMSGADSGRRNPCGAFIPSTPYQVTFTPLP
jgi:hypothetical protein